MEPRAVGIQDLAIVDPIAAYGIMCGVPRVPLSMNAPAVFSSFKLGQVVEGDLDTTLAQRTWIDNIEFSIQLPNVFQGQVFKTLFDAMLRQEPGISTRVTVHAGPKYLVSPNFTPMQNFTTTFQQRWPHGWPLYKQQSLKVEYLLAYAPYAVEANGPPLNVTMTFNGWQFLDHTTDEIDVNEAAERLRKIGFFVPKAIECR
jgi:hypothetical protein